MVLALLLIASPASAARIINLANAPKDLNITVAGSAQTIHLAPGEAWESRQYPVYALIGDHRLLLDPSTEYAYWPDGTLMPQHRLPLDSRGD